MVWRFLVLECFWLKTLAWGENIILGGEENLDKNLLRVNCLVFLSFEMLLVKKLQLGEKI